jgi:hypothetical protein
MSAHANSRRGRICRTSSAPPDPTRGGVSGSSGRLDAAPRTSTSSDSPHHPYLPLRRRRSRLGEPTVVYELVIFDGATTFRRELHRRQAAAVRDALQWFADHPPDGKPDPTTEPQQHDTPGWK